ncbi:hypothetical protein GX51_00615 [Blastomyces parvus]|uniref:Tim44-like domain-containing protein n=1 Tax=Blastomyces parvus TaxID=2060905 RepID=A0A2B7XKQ0_9EURO|nr:hypothetical protein GX51_00615 [Blastomyces parvus]
MASSLAPRSFALSSLSLRTTTTSPYINLRSSLRSCPSSPPSSRCILLSRRPFSHTTQREASMNNAQILRQKPAAQMSSKNQMREALRLKKEGALPDDVGLLPGTFVRPLWRNMPSIFRYPKERLWMEWGMVSTKYILYFDLQDVIQLTSSPGAIVPAFKPPQSSVLAYCKFLNRKNKLPLHLRERKRAALDLYKTVYTAFAAADTATLQNICCSGLLNQFLKRIAKRPPQAKKLVWTLHKFIKFPFSTTLTGARVVTDRAAQVGYGIGIRQVVVRIQSRQSLARPESPDNANSTQPQAAAGVAKNQISTEYIVLQKMMVSGKEEDWRVWGFTNETTMEDTETKPAFARGMSLKDRLELMSGRKF